MISKNATAPQTAKAGRVVRNPDFLNPRSKIDVASQGSGAGNDQSGADNKPPGIADFELLA